MTYLTVKISADQSRLLGEAWRRLSMGSYKKDITDSFLGLGCPSEYRPVVEAKLMEPSFRETPRVLNWYKLTKTGQAIIKQMVRKYRHVDCCSNPIVPPCGNFCKVKIRVFS